jgi:preprotein translocase subunit SecG
MLYGIILGIHILICIGLIAVILLQAGRGGGLADAFGGGAIQSSLGTRGTAFLTKMTTGVAATFIITSIILAMLSAQKGKSLIEEANKPQVTITRVKSPPKDAQTTEAVEGAAEGAVEGAAPKVEISVGEPQEKSDLPDR